MIMKAPILTNSGRELLIRALGGETITFTRFKIGNGVVDATMDPPEFEDLINPLVSFGITDIDTSDPGYVKLTGEFDNTYITEEFQWREIGIFCKGEDDTEVLYAYVNDENGAKLKANVADVAMEQAISIIVVVGDAENVTAILSKEAIYVKKDDFDNHIANTSNPHSTTAGQVGLGNVPNVATNDQTPTYETPNQLENLISGERLSVAFGKIRRAIMDFISHKNSKNPHGLELSDLGGAAEDHTHTTADINAGVLGVARGGTGVTSYEQLKEKLGVNDSPFVIGTYTGNMHSPQFVELGFTPTVVIVIMKGQMTYPYTKESTDYLITAVGGIAMTGHNTDGIAIVENGFNVSNARDSGSINTLAYACNWERMP